MAQQRSFVIIGNGIAGATAAEVLRSENSADAITVITDDPCPVFYRPALKDYLGGKIREEKLWARPISFYPDRQVRFLTGKVVGLQPAEHTLQLQNGQRIPYTRLLLAHGAQPTTLQCEGLNLQGVTTLRTVADYQRVLAHINNVRRAVVVGAGTLALESIETLRHRGYEVTHLLRKRTLWSDVLDQTASDLVLQQEQRDGVDIRMEQEIARINGRQGWVESVTTTTGQVIPCELVLLGIGIDPDTDFVKAAGIACGRGVKVDPSMRTNVADIYAAGDLVETADPITGKSRVIGQWYPAIQQARAAAYSMLDVLEQQYSFQFGNFYNACMLYGLDFASVGISVKPREGKDYQEIVADPQPLQYQKVILKAGVPVGMVALGDRRSVLTYKRAVDHKVNLSAVADRLFSPDFHLDSWMTKQGVPPAILGVNREEARQVQQAAYTMTKKDAAAAATSASAPAGVLEARLVPAAPPELVASLPLTYLSQTQVTTVGRQDGAKLTIQHPSVSRRHAEIGYANRQYILRDLASSNGTTVNDQRVKPSSLTLLQTGDRIGFGDVVFTFQVETVDVESSFLLRKKPRLATSMPAPAPAPVESTDRTTQLPVLPPPPQSQPSFNSDGTLSLPELPQPLVPELVKRLQRSPALVAIFQQQARIMPLASGLRLRIGRQADCELVVPDMSVSRQHAEVFFLADGFYIRDLGSSNGVYVNRNRITGAYRLNHEERITLGPLVLYFMNYTGSQPQAQLATVAAPPAAYAAGTGFVPRPTFTIQNCRQCGYHLTPDLHSCPRCGTPQR